MKKKLAKPGYRLVKRWAIVVKFADGGQTILRDFRLYNDAAAWFREHGSVNYYPSRTNTITVEEVELEVPIK